MRQWPDRDTQAAYDMGFSDGYRARMYESGEYMERGAGAARAAAIPGTRKGQRRKTARRAYAPKRKPSAYSKAYGVIYKQLKKKHPRASFGSLSKKAHAATRKKRGMKKGKK